MAEVPSENSLAYSAFLPGDRLSIIAGNQAITPGAIIFNTEPLLSIHIDCPYEQWNDHAAAMFYEQEHQKRSTLIKSAIRRLDKQSVRIFRSLNLPPGNMLRNPERIDIARFMRYAWALPFPADASSPNSPSTSLMVFPSISEVNHSCRPNAVFSFQDGRGVLRATDTIPPRQEICVDRLSGNLWLEGRSKRQEFLTRFDHDCRCEDCLPQSWYEGDRLRRRLKSLHQKLKHVVNGPLLDSGYLRAERVRKVWESCSLGYELNSFMRGSLSMDRREGCSCFWEVRGGYSLMYLRASLCFMCVYGDIERNVWGLFLSLSRAH